MGRSGDQVDEERAKSTKWGRSMKMRVGRPNEWSEGWVGQRIGAEGERMKRGEMWYEDEGRETGDETSDDIKNAGRNEKRENAMRITRTRSLAHSVQGLRGGTRERGRARL